MKTVWRVVLFMEIYSKLVRILSGAFIEKTGKSNHQTISIQN